jgi:hypothetical protein
MICPHCRAGLLRKQRTGNRCSSCRREFALDPKTNRLKLHDLRMRALTERLATRGRDGQPPLRFTAEQLRLAATRKVLGDRPTSGWLVGAGSIGCVGTVVAVAAAAAGGAAFGGVAAVVLVVVGLLVLGHVRTADSRRYPGLPVGAAQFGELLERWQRVYGQPPPGLLPAAPPRPVGPRGPVRAILVSDPDTVAFLAAAGLAERHPVLLVPGRPGEVPREVPAPARDGLPILVLHDADALGCLWVARMRAAFPGARVVDAGLRPVTAKLGATAVRLRPPAGYLAELRASGAVAGDALAWLAEGNTLPLAAVLPARLLRAAERAVTPRRSPDPDRERARAVGFLSGPEPG